MPPMPGQNAPMQAHAQSHQQYHAPQGGPQIANNPHSAFQTEDRRDYASKATDAMFSRLTLRSPQQAFMIAIIAFVILAVTISTLIIGSDRSKERKQGQAHLSSVVQFQVTSVTESLNSQLSWLNTALSANNSPAQIINTVSRGNGVSAAALLNNKSEIIAGTSNAAPLKSLNLSAFPQSGVIITSLIGADGTVNPVIVQKAGGSFLALALNQGSLVTADLASFALIESNGRVIDGPSQMGLEGSAAYFDFSTDGFLNLLKSGKSSIRSHSVSSQNVWMAMQPIPGSTLNLVAVSPRVGSGSWFFTLLLLALMCLGACGIMWYLTRNMLTHVQQSEVNNVENEISQQRYRAAIDSSRGGVWEIDLSRNEAYVSRSLSALLGLPEGEQTMQVTQFLNIFHESDRERLLYLARRAHMAGDFEVNLTVARLPILLSCRGHPLTRGGDNTRVIIGMALDVTEQRGSQARLQAAEARLFDALRSMNDSFVIWDQRDQLTLWNARFEDFFAFSPGMLSKGLDRMTVDYNAEKQIIEIKENGEGQGTEIRLKDGRWLRYLETSTADGGRVSIGTDITAIRTREYQLQKNEQALQKTIDVLRKSQTRIVELAESYEQEKIRAEEANQSKSEFLANMSHELRTPLNAINGFSDILKKEMFGPLGDPRYKEYVGDILFSGQHLLSLINDILDMSKIEAGKMNLNTEMLQMNEMIEQVVRILRGRAEENSLKLVFDAGHVPEIEADPRAVKQVLLNLMTNAIKFTPEGGVVSIDVTPKSAGLIISVSDTGIGISKDDIERLAKPFEQVETKNSRQTEGTGLGLALSKSLVELHGGNFKIESIHGEGTTVIFTLPNKPLKKEAALPDDEVADEMSRLVQDIAEVLSDGTTDGTSNDVPSTSVQASPLPSISGLAPMPSLDASPEEPAAQTQEPQRTQAHSPAAVPASSQPQASPPPLRAQPVAPPPKPSTNPAPNPYAGPQQAAPSAPPVSSPNTPPVYAPQAAPPPKPHTPPMQNMPPQPPQVFEKGVIPPNPYG